MKFIVRSYIASITLFIPILLLSNMIQARVFNDNWRDMQNVYKALLTTRDDNQEKHFSHPYWAETKSRIATLLQGSPNERFLFNPDLVNAMVRFGYEGVQHFEALYLNHCIKQETKNKISQFTETDFGFLPREIHDFDCSTNSLGHLYHTARLIEWSKEPLQTIVEFGSGYGNLARIMKMSLPETTLILIDFPELLAVQYLYLTSTLPEATVIAHTTVPAEFTQGAIHLVPVYLIDNLNVKADAFVSTFALSESPEFVQNKVVNKNFFDASINYLTGQISGWGSLDFVNESLLLSSTRKMYDDVICEPFHFSSATFRSDLAAYEQLARK